MRRDAASKWLQWSHSALMGMVLLVPSTVIIALYGTVALIWSGLFLAKSPAHKPGSKFEGLIRQMHIWGHRVLYLVAAAAGLCAAAQLASWDVSMRILVLMLIGAGSLHAACHLWRHTTLMDGAPKIVPPKAINGIL